MKKRSEEEKKELEIRLNKVEGQLRGIKRMVEEDRYCPDIITQVQASIAALESLNKLLLSSHISSCFVSDIQNGKEESIAELISLVGRMIK